MKKLLLILLLLCAGTASAQIAPPSTRPVVHLEWTTQPSGAVVSTNMTQQPVVTAKDNAGNTVTSFTGTVSLTKVNGTGSLTGSNNVSAVAGVATFSGLAFDTIGHYVLSASAPSINAPAVRSGMISVNPATTAARTVLHFSGSSDKVDCGSGSTVDNLTGSTMTVIVRVKRNTTGNNQFIISKYNTSNLGWYIQFDDGINVGDIVVDVNRATSAALGYTNNTTVVGTGTWYDIAFTWDVGDGTRNIRIYKGTPGIALAEISAYGGASNQGSGAVTTDAAANLWIGNLQIAPTNPALADIEWLTVFNTKLTVAQMLTVQTGFNRANTAMITNVGNLVGGWQLNATGTLTDFSGNSNTGTVTGATTATGQTIYVPTVWVNSIDAIDATDYLRTNSQAAVSYSTTATSVDISAQRVLEDQYDAQASITVLIDGVYNTEAQIGTVPTKAFATLALPAGSKTVTLVNGPRSRAEGSSPEGTFLTTLLFNASATEVAPTTPAFNYVFLADSIFDDFLAGPVGQYGAISQLREQINYSGAQVMVEGYGGASFYNYASDSTKRAATVVTLAKYNPTVLWIQLGVNDYNGSWTSGASTMQTAYDALLVALNAEMPRCQIYAMGLVTRPTLEGVADSHGSTPQDYRDAIRNAAAGKGYATYINGSTQIWDGTNTPDNSHPNNTGSQAITANIRKVIKR